MNDSTSSPWSLRPVTPTDIDAIAELRATVMRPDLERLGRYDEDRVRQRVRDSLSQHSSVIEINGALAGSITVRPVQDGQWLEHFYLAAQYQGRGLGSAVLQAILHESDAQGTTTRLNVLQGSPARRLYERHGFVLESEDPVDVYLVRPAPHQRDRNARPRRGES
ncbi:GCN5-related N-acetyltransferase [Kribbella flavida DSM 17836]|uniref:GCN5-related N-acetyltransferase n=1 Tax=Kribbella flavida (strain DSM 17836 / JCM 10339 / NBRC 14399) TaxID=479435 RepID=D2PVE8_KRIFD|nr:GNAT family N-acetyltransferase [Kribbella flavida]ADB33429.1 GCN5-related N-acetyltransferase [Kribbella flavida DSM 17836]